LPGVLRLEEERDVRVVEPRFVEMVLHDDVSGVRRPREVVNARLAEAVDHAVAGGGDSLLDLLTGRADLAAIANRHVDGDVVVSEVGEELAPGVELVAVPSALLEDADLWEPLDDHPKRPLPSRSARDPRQPRAEVDRDADGLAGGDRAGEPHFRDRAVV